MKVISEHSLYMEAEKKAKKPFLQVFNLYCFFVSFHVYLLVCLRKDNN